MKQKEMSHLTRQRMADSLKNHMKKKPLDKITVREITEDCDLNRQTFYYHFQDIYALTNWMFQQEALELLKASSNCSTWRDGIILLLDYIHENILIWNCALNSLGNIRIKEIFYTDAKYIINIIINELMDNISVSDDYLHFLTDFYIDAILGQVIQWASSKNPMPPERLMQYLDVTLYGNLEHALKRATEERL